MPPEGQTASPPILRFGTSGSSFLIDLHFVPVIVALLLSRMPTESLARLFVVVIVGLALNSALGIFEYVFHMRLTPFLVDGKPMLEAYFRPTALLGHPLQNALITAVAILTLPVLRDRRWLVWICGPIMAVSLIVFGGRSALAATLIVAFASGPIWLLRRLLRRNYSYRGMVGSALLAISLAGFGLLAMTTLGSGARVLSGFHWDDSANARIIGLRILKMVSPIDIMFGIGQQGIIERSQVLASYYGIIGLENSWLLLLLLLLLLLIFGAVGLAFFLVALIAWLLEILSGAPVQAYLGTAAYFIIASTNNTLAAKDSSLVHLVTLICGARAYALWAAQRGRRTAPATDRRPSLAAAEQP